jgi:hypothetical protein
MAAANPPRPPPMMAMLSGWKVFGAGWGEEMSGMVGVEGGVLGGRTLRWEMGGRRGENGLVLLVKGS